MSLPSSLLPCQASVTVLEFVIKTSWDSFPPGTLLLPPHPHRVGCAVVLEPGFSITREVIALPPHPGRWGSTQHWDHLGASVSSTPRSLGPWLNQPAGRLGALAGDCPAHCPARSPGRCPSPSEPERAPGFSQSWCVCVCACVCVHSRAHSGGRRQGGP